MGKYFSQGSGHKTGDIKPPAPDGRRSWKVPLWWKICSPVQSRPRLLAAYDIAETDIVVCREAAADTDYEINLRLEELRAMSLGTVVALTIPYC